MASSVAETVDEYLRELPAERREAIAAVRAVILDNLPDGYEEGMQYGMIGYFVPLERVPDTYNGKPLGYVALASQKQYMSLYLTAIYADDEAESWFRRAYEASGKKLNMGKSCVRFRHLDDLPLDVVAQAVARTSPEELIELHDRIHGPKARDR